MVSNNISLISVVTKMVLASVMDFKDGSERILSVNVQPPQDCMIVQKKKKKITAIIDGAQCKDSDSNEKNKKQKSNILVIFFLKIQAHVQEHQHSRED